MLRTACAALFALLAAGCLSPGEPPATRWFEPASTPPGPARETPAGALELARVDAAPALGTAIAWRLSAVELTFAPEARWAAEPASLVAESLRQALFESGRFREARSPNAARLDVHVRRFGGVRSVPPTAEVELSATLSYPGKKAAQTRAFGSTAPLEGDGHEALARAMGSALDRVVSELAIWLEAQIARAP